MPRNMKFSISQHDYTADRQMAKSEWVTADITKILLKKVKEKKELFFNRETGLWNPNLKNIKVFLYVQWVKYWIIQWLKRNWTKNQNTFAQANLITANKPDFLKCFLIAKSARENKLPVLNWCISFREYRGYRLYFTKPNLLTRSTTQQIWTYRMMNYLFHWDFVKKTWKDQNLTSGWVIQE